MRSKVETDSEEAEQRVRDIRRATRRQYSAEEKIRIVIAGLRGEDSIAELCRKEGINQKSLLPLVEGLPGGGQEAAGGRHRARSNRRRGQRDPGAGASAQGAGGRADDREPPA